MTRHAHIEGFTPAYHPQAGLITVHDAHTDAVLFQGGRHDVDLFMEVSGLTEHDVELSTHHHIFGGFE